PSTRSELVLPLIGQRESTVLGAVNIEMDRVNALTETDIKWLHAFCTPLAALISHVEGPQTELQALPFIWILVAGTGSYELPPNVLAAAERVGRWLADNRYGLITGGWKGVDHVVARSYGRTLGDKLSLDDWLIHVVDYHGDPDFRG